MTDWSLAQKSYRLCKKDYETEEEARAQQRAVDPLMGEWMIERKICLELSGQIQDLSLFTS
jgi:hypothetical protein